MFFFWFYFGFAYGGGLIEICLISFHTRRNTPTTNKTNKQKQKTRTPTKQHDGNDHTHDQSTDRPIQPPQREGMNGMTESDQTQNTTTND